MDGAAASAGGTRAARGRAAAPSRSRARARAPLGSSAARARRRRAAARARSARASSGHVSAESGRRVVQRATSSARRARASLVPERARLARRAVVGRGLADEVEPPRRARARRVEEVAVARDLVGLASRALAERPARVVVEERGACVAPRERSLLEPEHEDDLEAARARAQEVEDRDAARLAAARDRGPVVRSSAPTSSSARERAAELAPAFELVERAADGRFVRAQVERASLVRPEGLEPVGGAEHRARRARAAAFERRRRGRGAPRAIGNGCAAQAAASPPRRASGALIARPRRRPSRKSACARGEARVRRAQEAEELAARRRRARRSGAARGARGRTASARAEAAPRSRTGRRARRAPSRAARASARAPGRRSRSARAPCRRGSARGPPLRRARASRACPRPRRSGRRRRAADAGGGVVDEERPLEVRERRLRELVRSAAAAPRSGRPRAAPGRPPSLRATRTRRGPARTAARP